jgi:UDP-N-acetylglucosamine/UDP-N-acetylgalactosamine 4-epimerase
VHDPRVTNFSIPDELATRLRGRPRRWLVTGAAGFIGSHLVERLLSLDQLVTGLDNFATGRRENVDAVRAAVSREQAARYRFLEGDIRDPAACQRACSEVDVVLHEAALGSVPRSVNDPMTSHEVNVTGFLRVLAAAREAGIRRVVYASSSSVYGDHPILPKVEDVVGRVLSPYAATKYANELYAHAFGRCYGLELVGLRYFNVFGPRQDPSGPYAAVIPIWFAELLRGGDVVIHGDGETSRDFCYVANVVQANLLAATTERPEAIGAVLNVACGGRTTLNELFGMIRERVGRIDPAAAQRKPTYRDFRPGDVRHSLADIGKARTLLGYEPTHDVAAGLDSAAQWSVEEARAGGERDASGPVLTAGSAG